MTCIDKHANAVKKVFDHFGQLDILVNNGKRVFKLMILC